MSTSYSDSVYSLANDECTIDGRPEETKMEALSAWLTDFKSFYEVATTIFRMRSYVVYWVFEN